MDIIYSYIRQSGVNRLESIFKRVAHEGVKVRLITSTLMNLSEPAAIKELTSIIREDNVKVVTSSSNNITFHAKGWRFHESKFSIPLDVELGYSYAVIGSSNMSEQALKDGVEWYVFWIRIQAACNFR